MSRLPAALSVVDIKASSQIKASTKLNIPVFVITPQPKRGWIVIPSNDEIFLNQLIKFSYCQKLLKDPSIEVPTIAVKLLLKLLSLLPAAWSHPLQKPLLRQLRN
jgi:hypothetical protein